MTVSQLIEILKTLPQDSTVIFGDGSDITGANAIDFNAYFGADPSAPNDPVVIIT